MAEEGSSMVTYTKSGLLKSSLGKPFPITAGTLSSPTDSVGCQLDSGQNRHTSEHVG